jgi:hypothetical protein
MNLARAAALIVTALAAAGCAGPPATLQIVAVPPPGASRDIRGSLDDYGAVLGAIVDAFDHALGLPRAEVQLVLFPSRRSFEEGLRESGYTPALARSASEFAAIGGARVVLANSAVVNRLSRRDRVQLVAHELAHSLQYQFGGGTRGASEQWLREGFAEWVSYRVAAHLGLASFDRLRADLLDQLGGLRFGSEAAPLDALVTFPQWVEAQRRYELVYPQAFVAAELLIEQHGMPAVVAYFQRFRTTTDYHRAFIESFGMPRSTFERDLMLRWRQTVAQYRAR